MITVEYIWLDGTEWMPQLRSKTRVFKEAPSKLPDWSFDGGSTNQGTVEDSDRILKPVRLYRNPFKPGDNHHLVLCEVWDSSSVPHPTNHRNMLTKMGSDAAWFGFEQEYTFVRPDDSLAVPEDLGQGRFYCGVGCGNVLGRTISDAHLELCEKAGITLFGTNAEVMLSQWEFQTQPEEAVKASDDLWMARYILERAAEGMDIRISYHPKPSPNYNGAGCHTNFSTNWTRKSWDGVLEVLDALEGTHEAHMKVYGSDNQLRMTGACETSDYNSFTYGVGDRSASVRIPLATHDAECGYLEDRRPGANCDPYLVTSRLLETLIVC